MCDEPIEMGIVESTGQSDPEADGTPVPEDLVSPETPVQDDDETPETSTADNTVDNTPAVVETEVLPQVPVYPEWEMTPISDMLSVKYTALQQQLDSYVQWVLTEAKVIQQVQFMVGDLEVPTNANICMYSYNCGMAISIPWDPAYIGEVEKRMEAAGFVKVYEVRPAETNTTLSLKYSKDGLIIYFYFDAEMEGSHCRLETIEEEEEVTEIKRYKKYNIVCD